MKIGFIGIGNMGSAIMKGYLAAHNDEKDNIHAYDKDEVKREKLCRDLGINECSSLEKLMKQSDAIILAVKPQNFETVLTEARSYYQPHQVLVTIAAGISMGYIERMIQKQEGVKIVRVMPNTPALVNAGMSALCKNHFISDAEFEPIVELFRTIGRAEVVDETMMDNIIGISGSSPAYTYMLIEALIDAAAANGMGRDQAVIFAGQAVLGAAKMVLETGIDPAVLRENVCSPGGTTIEAVKALQNNGFHDNIVEAYQAAVKKSKVMTK